MSETDSPLFMFPSPLTDQRLWRNFTKLLPNLVAIDFEGIEEQLTTDRPTIEDYAAALAARVASHPAFLPPPRPVWIGGFCMGGMTAILVVNELLQRAPPPNIAGVVLLSSTAASAPALGTISRLAFRLFKDLSPEAVSMCLLRTYIARVGGKKKRRFASIPQDEDAGAVQEEPGFAQLYRTMLQSKQPEAAYKRLVAESRFNACPLLQRLGASFPPIHHLHGDRDVMLPYERIHRIHASIRDYGLEYHLQRLPKAGHFLPVTHPEETFQFLKQTLGLHSP